MEEVVSLQPLLEKYGAWTFADLEVLDLPDWWRVEIVDGSLVVSPPPEGLHELGSFDVRQALVANSPAGVVAVGPIGVDLGRSYLIPDLVVARRDDVRASTLLDPSKVLLVVEIVSPGSVSMDRLVKPAKYAAAGIEHFWCGETEPLSLTVYRLADDTYAEVGAWTNGQVELEDPFPVTIDIDAIG